MNATAIKEALLYGNKHRQGLFPEGLDASRWQRVKTDPFFDTLVRELREDVQRLLKEPIESLPFSLYKIFDQTGSRKEYERAYFRHRERLNAFAIVSMIDDDPAYLHALEDAIWAICDEYTWCLPAHLGGKSLEIIPSFGDAGAVRPQQSAVREHKHTVDLFAAETGFALSEILHLTGERLAPVVADRARKEIYERVLKPYARYDAKFGWELVTNNWAAVCAGSVGAAAIYLIEDVNLLASLIERLLGTMDCYLSGFENDGACTEGIGYWTYGFGFFTYFSALLEQRTGGKLNLLSGEKVKQIALFQQKCYLNERHTVSFSDAGLRASFRSGLTHYLKSRFDEMEVPDSRCRDTYRADGCFRWAHAVRSFVWSRPEYESLPQRDVSYYLPDAEWLISRKTGPAGIIGFAAKGGHNGEPHNHNDVGSFIFHVDGESLLTDTGSGEYTKAYFGTQRYTFLSNRSKGHSVPIVEDGEQRAGSAYRAQVVANELSDEADRLSLEMAAAYGNDKLKSLNRSFVFHKAGEPSLELCDRFSFTGTPADVTERFVSFCEPRRVHEGRVRIAGERNAVDIVYDESVLDFVPGSETLMTHGAKARELYWLDFKVKHPGTAIELAFKFEQVRL